MKIILASQSPRRRELMEKITASFIVHAADTDETLPEGISPTEAVKLLAAKKAHEVFALPQYAEDCVIGADTVVECGGEILGKPRDEADAARMLHMFSGGTHMVHTGLAILTPSGEEITSVTTEVDFYPLTQEEIAAYVASGEPFDKAGSYGIQTSAALFVKGIRGDYYNVMGFPIATVYRMLRRGGAI
ncbi:MAG: Maf family protein [Angelakisella sp.]